MLNDEPKLDNAVPGESLQHYGVKGMKWGVRKRPISSGSSSSKTQTKSKFRAKLDGVKGLGHTPKKPKTNKALERTTTKKSKKTEVDISKMSSQDLQNVIRRIQLEQQYKTAMNTRTAAGRLVDRGQKTAEDILFGSVKTVGQQYLTDRLNLVAKTIDPTYKPPKQDKKKDKDKNDDNES